MGEGQLATARFYNGNSEIFHHPEIGAHFSVEDGQVTTIGRRTKVTLLTAATFPQNLGFTLEIHMLEDGTILDAAHDEQSVSVPRPCDQPQVSQIL